MKVFFLGVVFVSFGVLLSPVVHSAEVGLSESRRENISSRICPAEFKRSDLCASLTWIKMPTDDSSGEFRLRFWKKSVGTESGPYVDPGNLVTVKLWMPAHGHGSAPVKVSPVKESSGNLVPGVFDATNVSFPMSGKWEIQIQLKKETQLIEQAILEYTSQ